MNCNNTNQSEFNKKQDIPSLCTDVKCVLLAIAEVIICILGITGNGLVIWIAGFKLKKSVNCMWYLSLAASDFVYCLFLPIMIINVVMQRWIFGDFMCKFSIFILFINMYSSIFLLVIISVDRCLVVILPVWAQNNRTIQKSSVVILLAWILSTVLSIHPTKTREVHEQYCVYNVYHEELIAMMVIEFVFRFVIPLLIIIFCYIVIMLKLRTNQMASSTKPFKVMTLLIVTFFISWLPYHIMNFLIFYHEQTHIVKMIKSISIVLYSSNSCINPLLYAFMGKDFKKKFYSLRSKIENAFKEDGQNPLRGTFRTISREQNLSTSV